MDDLSSSHDFGSASDDGMPEPKIVTEVMFKNGILMTVEGTYHEVNRNLASAKEDGRMWEFSALNQVRLGTTPTIYSADPWEVMLIGQEYSWEDATKPKGQVIPFTPTSGVLN